MRKQRDCGRKDAHPSLLFDINLVRYFFNIILLFVVLIYVCNLFFQLLKIYDVLKKPKSERRTESLH